MDESARKSGKIWRLLPHDAAAIDRLSKTLNVQPIVAQLLANRRIDDQQSAERFLNCPLTGLHEPELLYDIPRAVDRLFEAIQSRRRICVYGDYDVDGVTGTAILLNAFRLLGGNAEFHVPHRLAEGYGLNVGRIRTLAESGVQTIVSVDCGIAGHAEADEARSLGVELIVTDHHEFKDTLPDAACLVHPRLPTAPTAYPFGMLSGAGVAFKLAWALCKKASGGPKVSPELREFLLDSILLAAMGTVADVVPLVDENRIFVRHGLHRLKMKPPVGVQALLRTTKLEGKAQYTTIDIGYSLAPRINAAGRLGTARLAVELFTTQSAEKAGAVADFLERQNHERQLVERRILQEAKDLAHAQGEAPALVLAGDDWHPGLLGIVASRLVDQFARPVLMIAKRGVGEPAQGSGRSVPGFKLHEALQQCSPLLISHGGHATASGFRIDPANIAEFQSAFHGVASSHFGGLIPAPEIAVDAEVPFSALTTGLLEAIQKLEPYGAGNPEPVLLADRLQIVGEPRKVGVGERHLTFKVRQQSKDLRAIAFGMADRVDDLMSQAGRCCLAFTPRINEWQGFRSVEIEVRDFQPGPDALIT